MYLTKAMATSKLVVTTKLPITKLNGMHNVTYNNKLNDVM